MNTPSTCTPARPVLARAADNGMVLAICITALTLLCGAAMYSGLASLLMIVLSLAMPWILYRLLLRSRRHSCSTANFAELWAEGIASFFLGSLIPAVVAYLLLKFAFPGFIADCVNEAIASFEAMDTEQGEMWASTMRRIVEHNALPGASDVAANIISINIVAGTVMSLFVVPFVSMKSCGNTCTPSNQ